MDDLYLGFEASAEDPLNFLEARLHDLSPFAALEVQIDGVIYKTAEHAYQALRIVPGHRENIIKANSPFAAWYEGQKLKGSQQLLLRIDKEELMEQIFRAKLAQHSYLKEVLLATGNRQLLKIMPADSFWGTGTNGEGQNKMGKLWMKLRSELQ